MHNPSWIFSLSPNFHRSPSCVGRHDGGRIKLLLLAEEWMRRARRREERRGEERKRRESLSGEDEEKKMVQGKLEVLLVGAKGLENSDYLKDMDSYAILKFCSQEQRSSIASGKGTEPEWNENFVFTVSHNVSEFKIRLMDSDSGTEDDFVGEVEISLEPLFAEGNLPPTVYNVVKDQEYKGELKVGFSFTPDQESHQGNYGEESYGGWNESA